MKKSGGAAATEKRRVRRSPGALQSSARDSNSDASPKKQAPQKDVFQLFADKVRDHKGLESRWAVLQETRVEYFKGKDFISFLKNNAEEQVFSDSDAFFAWAFVKRHPLWQTLLSFFWPVLTLAICLFPVYPHQVKLLILYSCAGILLLILSLLFVRAAMFGALYILVGKRTWFFPNILAEEATLRELFRFWPRKDEEERPKWTTRLFYAIVAMLVILLLRHHAPDEAARARCCIQEDVVPKASFKHDDVLEWSPKLALSGMMEKQLTVVNATESNCSSAHCTNTGPDVGAGAETPAEQHVEEVGDV
ncbi:hypothetical protein SAY87_013649 [Trapa incisa]|uniref:Translocation protein SEC62 n=1 Tax=Trapa incisa TaxID=236973 RepID=A0AAN7KHP0_9MYRT|nr:hypothetical protein SAY87_013649 [Trapa incisa]